MLNRPTLTRDPANPSGGIFVPNSEAAQTNPAAAGTGSKYFSANVADQWQVINAKGVVQAGGPYANEQLAANAATTANAQGKPNPELEINRGAGNAVS